MKRKILLLFFAIPFLTHAQQKLSYKFYGFVENQLSFNSRKNVEAVGMSFNIMPLPEKLDPNGKDLNAVPAVEMLAINSRVGVDVSGLELFNSQVSSKIEADFAGAGTTYYVLRIRRAYVNMNRENTQLLVGQEWHPLSGSVMPATFELNGGAPFNPFNRSPQINFKYKMGNWKWTAAALYEMQFLSDGPLGKTPAYQRDAMMPNFYLGLENSCEHFRWGVGADVKMISPRTQSINDGLTYSVNENLTTFSYMVFGEYAKDKLTVKAKAIYGQNLTNMMMVGMYGVSGILDEVTGRREYEAFNVINSWLNITYGGAFKVGLYAGYIANLGTNKALLETSPIYGYGYVENKIVDNMYRIMPQVSYTKNNWKVGLEGGFTTAGYGNVNFENGKAIDAVNVTNYRILSVLCLIF